MNKIFDTIIIGAGPTGLSCAISASRAGLDYFILEKGVLVNSIFHFPSNMTFFSTSKLLEIGDVPFISHSDKPTRREALEYYRRVYESWNLKAHFFESISDLNSSGDGSWIIKTTKGSYLTRTLIISTGFFDKPHLMQVPGEHLEKVRHYYDEAHPYIGQKLLVVGSANSACDVALECYQKGSEVTMVIREKDISPRVKYWIRPNIKNRINEGSIKAYFQSKVKEILPDKVLIVTDSGELQIPNDFVLAMTGYEPDYLLLEKLGLRFRDNEARTPILNRESFESNLPGVFLAGVLHAGLFTNKLFIENTRHHGDVIIPHIKRHIGK